MNIEYGTLIRNEERKHGHGTWNSSRFCPVVCESRAYDLAQLRQTASALFQYSVLSILSSNPYNPNLHRLVQVQYWSWNEAVNSRQLGRAGRWLELTANS